MKIACTVWSGGKLGDYLKELPITINPLDRGNIHDKQRGKESNAVQRNFHCADNPKWRRDKVVGKSDRNVHKRFFMVERCFGGQYGIDDKRQQKMMGDDIDEKKV